MSTTSRLVNRVQAMITKALVNAVIDTGQIQLVKVETTSGEVQDGVERVQNYGLSSNPPTGSEAVVGYIQGDRSHGVVIACDSGTYRVKALPTGEVVIYSMHGQQILLKTSGAVEITAPGGVKIGGGSTAAAKAAAVDTLWSTLYAVFTSWSPAATDGGAALKAAFMAAFPSAPSSTASSNLEID